MGGAASPSPYTQSVQQIQGGWMANPTARAIGLPILKEQGAYDKSLMDMMVGVNKNDPASLAKFYGLPSGASTADIVGAISNQRQSPTPVDTSIQQQPVPLPPRNPAPTPTKTAARGGVMSLRGYATGGAPAVQDLTAAQRQAVAAFNATIAGGGTPTAAQIAQINSIEQTTGRNVSPYTNTGTAAVGNTALQNSIAAAAGSGNYPTGTGTSPAAAISDKYPNSAAANTIATNPTNVANADALAKAKQNAGLTAADAYVPKTYGTDVTTDASGKSTMSFTDPNYNKAVGTLDQMSQGTGLYGGALNSVAGQGGIMSQLQGMANYSPQQVAAQNAAASQASAQQGSAQQATAQQASSQGYNASNMTAPSDIQAQGYTAAQAQGNQMQGPRDVNAVNAQASQMAGPQQWSQSQAQQYMDPYIQSVVQNQQALANQNYAQQLQQLKGSAVKQGAFGGSREAIAEAQSNLNQGLLLNNIASQGLSNAYQQGLSQFNTGQGQNLQAGQANLTAAQQVALANQQAGMTSQQLNQQAGLTTGQANLTAAQQTALANQQAQNAQMQQYVQNQLAAATTSYGGKLTAEQQNQIAQNAAAQFTAAAGNTAQLTNAQLGTQTSNANASLGTQASLQNASLGTQAAMQNASLGTQASLANAQNALQASMANQSAGLQANQQGIGALTNAGNMGMGVGNMGFNVAGGYGTAAGYTTGRGDLYNANQYTGAGNIANAPNNAANQVNNSLNTSAGGSKAGSSLSTGSPGSTL